MVEDEKNGQYLFAYEIGQMENVPLYTIKDFGNTSGLTVSETITSSGTITESTSKSIVNAVANSTTRTTAWTLSKNWNDSMTLIQSHTDESGQEIVDQSGRANSDTSVSLSSREDGGSDDSSTTDKNGVSAKIGTEVGSEVSSKVSASLGAKKGPFTGNISGEVGSKFTAKIDSEVYSSHEDT